MRGLSHAKRLSLQAVALWRRHILLRFAVCVLEPTRKRDEFFADGGVDGDGGLKVLRMIV